MSYGHKKAEGDVVSEQKGVVWWTSYSHSRANGGMT